MLVLQLRFTKKRKLERGAIEVPASCLIVHDVNMVLPEGNCHEAEGGGVTLPLACLSRVEGAV